MAEASREARRRHDEAASARLVAAALALDVLLVGAFALAGRRSHDEAMTLAGWWHTAWAFLVGLGIGWLTVVLMTRRAPVTILTGLPVWVATVGGGMALRDMTDQGTALPFVLVATGTLGLGLLAWRAVRTFATGRAGRLTAR